MDIFHLFQYDFQANMKEAILDYFINRTQLMAVDTYCEKKKSIITIPLSKSIQNAS